MFVCVADLLKIFSGAAKHRREEEGEESDDFIKVFPDGYGLDAASLTLI